MAHALKQHKPHLLHNSFIPGLKGIDSKMSASEPNTAIFMSDTNKQVHNKIMRHAFSGGRDTAEEQREFGANVAVDVSCRYLSIYGRFNEFIPKLTGFDPNKILDDYSNGIILTGTLKKILIDILCNMLTTYRKQRVSDSILNIVMSLTPINDTN